MITLRVLCQTLFLEAIGCLPTIQQRQQPQYTRLVVFGDSFSDDGNGAWIASNMTWPADPAYAGHHFSNGPVWAQDLASSLGITLLDYAAGGATADNNLVQGFTGYNSTIPVPSTIEQITDFLSNDTVGASDVLVIYIGANDILFNINITSQQITQVIEGQVHRLHDQGARTVLLANYPPLNTLPALVGSDESEISALEAFSSGLSQGLDSIAAGWSPYISIAVADVGSLFQMIQSNPEAYGINATYVDPPTACLVGAYPGEGPRTLCSDPERHLFFDTYHPVYQVHQLISEVFRSTLESAPTK